MPERALICRPSDDVVALKCDAAGACVQGAGQCPHQNAITDAVAPDHPDDLAGAQS
jgi:hypothetical protein